MNLLEILRKIFGGDFAALASRFLGEPESNTKSAITSMLPALLGAIVQKGSTPDGASSLLNTLNSPQVDANLPGNISQLLGGGGANRLVTAGSGLLNSFLGSRANAFTGALSSMSGMSGTSATSLVSMAVPLIMGGLKKIVGDQGLGAHGLMSLLRDQTRTVESSIDPRLSQAMNLRLPSAGQAATETVDTVSTGMGKAIPWIIAAIAALLGIWLLRNCSAERTRRAAEERQPAAEATARRTPETPRSVVGPIRSIDLPSGEKINAPQGGFIDSLVAFLSNPNWVPGKSFSLDAVTFEANSATLAPSSTAQLTQLATVLKEYPSTAVSVDGHTDNTADPAANKKLSEDRAAAVKDALVNMGLPADRVTSTGWGADKPIASNDTEEGRLKNRRVEITLQKK